MPAYDYKCNTCGNQQEVTKEIGDDTLPLCCGTSMNRLWSAIPTIFKTGGFYKTGG